MVVWDTEGHVTNPAWTLYWSPDFELTFACVYEQGHEVGRLLLPCAMVLGHWDWYAGQVDGYRIAYGYEGNYQLPKYLIAKPTGITDPDTGYRYWMQVG